MQRELAAIRKYIKNMNILDIILALLVVTGGGISGLKQGFVFQITTLVALLAGVYLSFLFYPKAAAILASLVEWSPNVLNVQGFILIFLLSYGVIYLAGLLMKHIVHSLLGAWVDKLLGVLLSTMKCVLILGLFILVFDSINSALGLVRQDRMDGSFMYCGIKHVTDFVFPYLKELVASL